MPDSTDATAESWTCREHDLVARALAGDEAAFVELAALHRGSSLRLARALGHAPADAERLGARAWSRVLAALRAPAGRPLRVRLLAAVAGCARAPDGTATLRAGPDATHREPSAGAAPGAGRFDRAGRWADPPRPWGARLTGTAARRALEAAIAALPAEERAVLVLRDVEGLGAADASAILAIDDEAQRRRLHRGRARLRAAVSERIQERASLERPDPVEVAT